PETLILRVDGRSSIATRRSGLPQRTAQHVRAENLSPGSLAAQLAPFTLQRHRSTAERSLALAVTVGARALHRTQKLALASQQIAVNKGGNNPPAVGGDLLLTLGNRRDAQLRHERRERLR